MNSGSEARPDFLRVLIVSSDPVTCRQAASMIERLGHESDVVEAFGSEGRAAIDACDVLLIDTDTGEPDHAWERLSAAGGLPYVIAIGADAATPPFEARSCLHKPVSLQALAAALDTASGFDADTWGELLQLFGHDGLGEMVAALQHDLPQQQERLQAALRDQDRRTVRHIVHSLRGVALQFGATHLADCCGSIEQSVANDAPLDQAGAAAARMLDRHAALARRLHGTLRGA
jgi:HPt (histidine-containing phosphotransfer) domain-containing protein